MFKFKFVQLCRHLPTAVSTDGKQPQHPSSSYPFFCWSQGINQLLTHCTVAWVLWSMSGSEVVLYCYLCFKQQSPPLSLGTVKWNTHCLCYVVLCDWTHGQLSPDRGNNQKLLGCSVLENERDQIASCIENWHQPRLVNSNRDLSWWGHQSYCLAQILIGF